MILRCNGVCVCVCVWICVSKGGRSICVDGTEDGD